VTLAALVIVENLSRKFNVDSFFGRWIWWSCQLLWDFWTKS